MSTSPATVMTVQPPWRRTCTTSASSMACSPPLTRRGRAGQGRAGRGELAGVPGQERGHLGDPGGDGLVPGAGRGDVGPAPQPPVGGAPAAQLLPSLLADRAAVPVVVQGLHICPGLGGPVSPPCDARPRRPGRPGA